MRIEISGIYFHIFELPVIIFLAVAVLLELSLRGTTLQLKNNDTWRLLFASLILLLFSVLLSTLVALNPTATIKELLKWIEIIILIGLLFVHVSNKERFITFYWILFISNFVFVIYIFISVLFGRQSLFDYRIFPGHEATFALALLIPFVNHKHSNLVWITVGILVLSSILSLSRGAWLSLLIIFYFSYRFLNKEKRRILLVFSLLAIILVLAIPSSRAFIAIKICSMFAESSSNVERMSFIKTALIAFWRNPIVGIGAMNFPEFVIREGRLEGIVAENISIVPPHNTFIQIAAEEGLFGLIPFMLLIISMFLTLYKSTRIENVPQQYSSYIFGMRLFFWLMLIYLMFGYISSPFRFFFMLFIGLSASIHRLLYQQSY